MTLDLTSFEKALASLGKALNAYQHHSDGDNFIRDACIRRFAYTYDQSHKILKRYLQAVSPNPTEIDSMSFQELIRVGAAAGMLRTSWDVWQAYRAARSATSDAYDEHKAAEVYGQIPAFFVEATALFENLNRKSA